jgi:hypothetical protein
MDTFGRLPNDILCNIINLFSLPEIEIIQQHPEQNPQDFCMKIKYQLVTTKLDIVSPLVMMDNHVFIDTDGVKLTNFIKDLSDDIDCIYDYSYYDNLDVRFQINFIDDMIKIKSKDTKIILTRDTKDQLIIALKKYHDILKKYI